MAVATMSSAAEEVEAPLPPTSDVIMPAKSEDKLEIEREEKERGNEEGKEDAEGADEKKDEEVSILPKCILSWVPSFHHTVENENIVI